MLSTLGCLACASLDALWVACCITCLDTFDTLPGACGSRGEVCCMTVPLRTVEGRLGSLDVEEGAVVPSW